MATFAARAGARIVWMPTFDGCNEMSGHSSLPPGTKQPQWARLQQELRDQGISSEPVRVVDEEYKVLPEVRKVLHSIAKHDLVLATGHLGRDEIFAVVEAAGFLPEYYFIEDRASDVPYYGYYTADGVEPRTRIYVEDGYARPAIREISEVSEVVRGLGRGYELHRICFPAEVKECFPNRVVFLHGPKSAAGLLVDKEVEKMEDLGRGPNACE